MTNPLKGRKPRHLQPGEPYWLNPVEPPTFYEEEPMPNAETPRPDGITGNCGPLDYEAEYRDALAALRELVRLKDLHEEYKRVLAAGQHDEVNWQRHVEYEKAKPAAWYEARRVATGEAPEAVNQAPTHSWTRQPGGG